MARARAGGARRRRNRRRRWIPSRHVGWPKIVECLINLGEKKKKRKKGGLLRMDLLHFIVAMGIVRIHRPPLRTIPPKRRRDLVMRVRLAVMVAMPISTVITRVANQARMMMMMMMEVVPIVTKKATPRKNRG